MDPNIHAASSFVQSLALQAVGSGRLWRPAGGADLVDPGAGKRGAFVVAASVVAFSDGVTGQQKEDLLNSTLLAQLAANRQHDRERDFRGWYGTYREVLEKVGWRPESCTPAADFRSGARSFDGGSLRPGRPVPAQRLALPKFLPVRVARPRFTADVQVLGILRSQVAASAFNVAEAAVQALGELDERDRRVVIFESSSHGSARGNFQIIAAAAGTDQVLRMTIACVFFVTMERVARVLTFPFGSRDTQMTQVRESLALDEAQYGGVRDDVIQQLGDQAAACIDALDIG